MTPIVFMIFYVPIFVGLIVRFLIGNRKKGYLLSVVGALAACVVWLFVLLNGNGVCKPLWYPTSQAGQFWLRSISSCGICSSGTR